MLETDTEALDFQIPPRGKQIAMPRLFPPFWSVKQANDPELISMVPGSGSNDSSSSLQENNLPGVCMKRDANLHVG
jgi:hypothetical protein